MEIRALSELDDRSAFECGDPNLDRFLRIFAGQNQFKHHVGVTYVAVDARKIVGYCTVAPGQIEIDGLPAAARKRLPRYPLPVLRLARLAVDRSAQGAGLGRALLRFVLELAVRMARDYGCAGVLVDAKPNAIAFYAKHRFSPVDPVEGMSAARPAPTLMFLSIRAISSARRESQ